MGIISGKIKGERNGKIKKPKKIRIKRLKFIGIKFLGYHLHISVLSENESVARKILKMFSLFERCGCPIPEWNYISEREKRLKIRKDGLSNFGKRGARRGIRRVVEEIEIRGKLPTDILTASLKITNFVKKASREKGLVLIHGASVSLPNSATIILVGKEGRGKSTSTKIFLESGFGFITEDTLILDLQKGSFIPFPKPIFFRDERKKFRKIFIPASYEKAPKKDKVVVFILEKKIKDRKIYMEFKRKIKEIADTLKKLSWKEAKKELVRRKILCEIGREDGIIFTLKHSYIPKSADKSKLISFLSKFEFFTIN